MSTSDIKTAEWLEDSEMRAEYGSATLKYDIAAALVAARKMKNITQAALANIAGVSQAYIAKLESGEANPTIGRIGSILASIWLKLNINSIPLLTPEHRDDTSFEQTSHQAIVPEQKSTVEVLQRVVSPSANIIRKEGETGLDFQQSWLNLFAQEKMANPITRMWPTPERWFEERIFERPKNYLLDIHFTNISSLQEVTKNIFNDVNTTNKSSIDTIQFPALVNIN